MEMHDRVLRVTTNTGSLSKTCLKCNNKKNACRATFIEFHQKLMSLIKIVKRISSFKFVQLSLVKR